MAMVVKNNMSAVSTLNTLNKNSSALQKSLQKVSSGMKINSAQDDASGYAISEKMRVQIRSLDQANQNTQNASSLMKTAEGAVSSTVEILKSLKEKAINAATDTNTDSDRATIQKELDQFIDQIDDNALTTFNGKYLVDGSKNNAHMNTRSAFTNQSMAIGTTGNTYLADNNSVDQTDTAKNRTGESLEISSTDYVTASFVKDGKTYTTTYQVGDTTINDIFTKMNDEYVAQEKAAGNSNATAAFGGTAATGPKMNYADATKYITDTYGGSDTEAANAAYSKIIAKTDGSDAKLGEALATIYTTNANGDDLSAKTNVTDDISKALIDQRDVITKKISDAITAGTSYNQAGGFKSGNDTNTVKWKDESGADTAGVTGAVWNAAAGKGPHKEYVTDAIEAAAGWTPDGNGSIDEAGSAAGAAARVFDSLVDGSNTVVGGDELNAQNADVQKLANAALMRAAAEAVTNIGKEEPFDAVFVKPDGSTEKSADAADDDAKAALDAKYTLSDDKLKKLGVNFSGDDSKRAEEIKNALETVLTDLNGSNGINKTNDADKVKSSDYPGTRGKVTAENVYTQSTQANYATVHENLDKADALYNAWQAEQLKTSADDAGTASTTTTTTTGRAHDENTPDPTDLVHQGSDIGVNKSDDTVYTNDGTEGLTVTASTAGLAGQISGVTISISDSDGNVKKAANASLDQFKMSIRAENRTTAVDGNNNLTFQVGAAANQAISVSITDMRSEALGLKGSDGTKVSVATKDKANAAVAVFDNAITKALDQQTTIGAVEARLDYTSSNLTTMSENVQSAESTIRDADMAKEMTNYTKNNVLLQAAQSMLAQANQSSSQVLSLLQ